MGRTTLGQQTTSAAGHTGQAVSPVLTRSPRAAHAADVLLGMSEDMETLAHAIEPSVVKIYSTGLAPVETGDVSKTALLAQERSVGSGVIMDPEGYILTNAHVVQHARSLSVLIADMSGVTEAGSTDRAEPPATAMPAHIVGLDTVTDLAVIKVEKHGLRALKFADSDRAHAGELVLAFGSPLGLQDSVSLGVISATNQQLDSDSPMVYLQTDAAINPGNSGGPLIDMHGDVVGINSMIETQSGGNEGVGFSIPSNTARIVYEQLVKYGRPRRGAIGVYPANITPTLAEGLGLSRNSGVVIEDVVVGSQADRAGITIGDIILSADNRPIRDTKEFALLMFRKRPGEKVHLEILTGAAKREMDVEVMQSPRDAASLIGPADAERYLVPRLGALVLPITPDVLKELGAQREPGGLLVVARTFGIAADEVNLKTGDILYYANKTKLDSVAGLKDFMNGLKSGDPVVLQVERAGLLNYVSFRFEE
ncbi:MAG TPA: trypsin-like peptidase domain-containing protein [Acidobacteriaceae bacterium]|nr:trypsin-like peptidase domain-containing protein [Acidobacteriaceae bacterium]